MEEQEWPCVEVFEGCYIAGLGFVDPLITRRLLLPTDCPMRYVPEGAEVIDEGVLPGDDVPGDGP